ncbi:SubName: Full=Uncharacterized protein {ECO:0000313/EMBL:CCA71235.1} [Serendipita indica DSM 11827]|nr:SubName: Full=Uncharacterized protein {ECO:0000313/EMBL:CCA71235.1} [Serendipita indica DSM 11827]
MSTSNYLSHRLSPLATRHSSSDTEASRRRLAISSTASRQAKMGVHKDDLGVSKTNTRPALIHRHSPEATTLLALVHPHEPLDIPIPPTLKSNPKARAYSFETSSPSGSGPGLSSPTRRKTPTSSPSQSSPKWYDYNEFGDVGYSRPRAESHSSTGSGFSVPTKSDSAHEQWLQQVATSSLIVTRHTITQDDGLRGDRPYGPFTPTLPSPPIIHATTFRSHPPPLSLPSSVLSTTSAA